MKFSRIIAACLGLGLPLGFGLKALIAQDDEPAYNGSVFNEVLSQARQGKYDDRPYRKVTSASFFRFFENQLAKDSERTLSDRSDILPPFRKLLHPNGICLVGTWNIEGDSPYSGYFRAGRQGLVIARASAALTAVKQGQKRSFGMAVKIFPSQDPQDQSMLKTANFFVIDDLGGTYIDHFRDTPMTNDISSVNFGVDNAGQLLIAAIVTPTLQASETIMGSSPSVRQVYQVAELGEADPSQAITPKWIRIQGEAGSREDYKDFRDELIMANNDGRLRFEIAVTSDGELGEDKPFEVIGYMEFTESFESEGCDSRLHFNHPSWRTDLTHF
ncbi:hypothetical protein [Pseudobacteriovorax antillogorgiicola]|uniref:Uncharacterized protein n=1 Tax=Pseudobacteriovorax antillogorgiicola TaxID=1513793 RepID=A0A1Y6C5L7_9BACT|nr:hypothetical protein [Pseudobacteriovorax antillogorgiicola]TCS49821.1 hypothetical protein EDD56_11466 [Pseudobacteriovorax antillogorgiicola]SMF43270.1 hypothetical protein SAMN06296036_11365 [Pseudobacteriovorax antillogorgiicola]